MIYPKTNSQYADEFNLSNKRNTPRRTYNCGGFALGCIARKGISFNMLLIIIQRLLLRPYIL